MLFRSMSIDSPLNVATPFVAASVTVPLSVPPGPPFVPIASVMLAVDPVTVFPFASCTVTTGCVAQLTPDAPPPGCVVNTTFVALPALMLNALLVAPVSPLLAAVSV